MTTPTEARIAEIRARARHECLGDAYPVFSPPAVLFLLDQLDAANARAEKAEEEVRPISESLQHFSTVLVPALRDRIAKLEAENAKLEADLQSWRDNP